MIYVVFADDVHDVICVEVNCDTEQEATSIVRKTQGRWIDTMCFDAPPMSVPVKSVKDIAY